MSERAEDKRLKELRDAGHEIYSISRLDCINNCLFSAYKKYVLHEKEKPNIYSSLGGRIHEVLEGITNNTNTESDLLEAMNDELEDMQMLGIEFPKDRNEGDSIRENWIKNMTNFCKTYKAPRNKKLEAERLFIYETDNHEFMQGYIDLIWHKKDGTISIFDFKTSTMYGSKEIKEHARQLILYALGMEQEGYTVSSASWIMLKYWTVTFQGYKTAKSKTRTTIVKHIERRKLYSELAKHFQKDLEEMGMDSLDVEITLDNIKNEIYNTGTIPDILKDKYILKPCIIDAELTSESKQETLDYINETIKKWKSLNPENINDYPPRNFLKTKASDGSQVPDTWFCHGLCGYYDNCPWIHDFNDQYNEDNNTNEDDLF